MSVERNKHVALHCQAQGVPTPTIVWKKATGEKFLWFIINSGVQYLLKVSRTPKYPKNIYTLARFFYRKLIRPRVEYSCIKTFCETVRAQNARNNSVLYYSNIGIFRCLDKIGSKSGEYEELRERPYTKILSNGTLLLQHVKEDREGFYLCQASNGIGSGIGKVVHLKVNCKYLRVNDKVKAKWLLNNQIFRQRGELLNKKRKGKIYGADNFAILFSLQHLHISPHHRDWLP